MVGRWGIGLVAVCFFLWVGLVACDREKERQEEGSVPPPPGRPLTIGLIPEQDIFAQKRLYAPLADHLAQVLGMPVELKILSRYGNIIDNFHSEGLDGAFFGSFTGALAISRLGVVPVARPEYEGGRSSYRGLIFARKDSGIKTPKQMRGKIFVFVDRATTAGWLLPLHYFKEHGVTDHRRWFRESYFSGTHEDAILDVLEGRADVGAAKDFIFDKLVKDDPTVAEKLEILATSPPVPANTIALRSGISPALRNGIRHALLTMEKTPEGRRALASFGARRFVETFEADYQTVFHYAQEVGIDLARYEYRNH